MSSIDSLVVEPLRFPRRPSRRRPTVRLALLGAAGVAGIWLLTACVPAATFVVDTGVDAPDAVIGDGVCATAAGACSLRAAVQEGNANVEDGPIRVELGGREVFALTIAGAGEDAAATGDLDLTRPFQFVGTGLPKVTMTGDRVFDARPGGDLTVNGLAITGAGAADGGAIKAFNADVSLNGSSVSGTATNEGGAIWSNRGAVTLTDTGIGKSSAPHGAAVYAGQIVMVRSSISGVRATVGGVVTLTSLDNASTIDSSTIVGNEGPSILAPVGPVTMRDSTVARNTSTFGAITFARPFSIGNSIIADQIAGPGCGLPAVSLGHNLESGTSCGFTAAGDLSSTPSGLDSSTDPAGTTVVLPLRHGAAIDSGASCLALDQAWVARPLDGDTDGIATCDRGAFEAVARPLFLQVDSTADGVDADPGDGLCATTSGACTLRAAVMETNARTTVDLIDLPGDTIHGLSIAGTGEDDAATGDLDISGDLTIRSADEGGALSFLDGNDVDRILDVHQGTVVLEQLALGDATEVTGGGALRVGVGADVTLVKSTLFANVGTGGGAIQVSGGLTVDRSTVYSNQGGSRGGAILVTGGGALSLVNSTLASNTATSGSALSVDLGSSATILDSTLAGNTGVGVERLGTITIQGSIVSGHVAGNCSAPLATLGANLDSGASCGFTGAGDAQGVDPLLGGLAGNGGPLLTRRPAAGSTAIGTNLCSTASDQRGIARPQGGACDKGAVEQ